MPAQPDGERVAEEGRPEAHPQSAALTAPSEKEPGARLRSGRRLGPWARPASGERMELGAREGAWIRGLGTDGGGHEHGPFFEGAAELARLGMCLRTPVGADVSFETYSLVEPFFTQ